MPAAALALALSAAVLHAAWNLLLARARDTDAAAAVAYVVASLVFAPVAAIRWHVDAGAWPYIAGSAALEVVYIGLLATAYARAPLSVVYPIARGTAPVLVLVIGATVLGVATSARQAAGVCLVGAGVVLVRGVRRAARGAGAGLALLIAMTIAGYTVIDKRGVAQADPLAYFEAVMVPVTAVYAAGVLRLRGTATVRAQVRPGPALAGLLAFGAYALFLTALRLAPAAPVAAVRESGVVIATAMAALFLGERVGLGRYAGACVVIAGVVLLGT